MKPPLEPCQQAKIYTLSDSESEFHDDSSDSDEGKRHKESAQGDEDKYEEDVIVAETQWGGVYVRVVEI